MGKYTWGQSVKVKAEAKREFNPGSLAVVVGVRAIETRDQEKEFGATIGSVIYLVEFPDGFSIEVPEKLLEATQSE